MKLFAILLFSAAWVVGAAQSKSTTSTPPRADQISATTAFDGSALDQRVPSLLAAHHAAGAGVVVIRGGRISWSGYYGHQGPNVPASKDTMFNGASLAKTITAETTLRLASAGSVSLDEPIWRYYAHPDLANDPRYKLLTPRIILSHQTGLLNWPYLYQDGKLAFVANPGDHFTYSGAGYEILASFLERKLKTNFEDLVRQHVFEPLGLKGISLSRHAGMNDRVTTPMNDQGKYESSYRTDAPANPHHPLSDSWNAAADLFTTAEDYARFLSAVMRDDGLTSEVAAARRRIYASFSTDPDWACDPASGSSCPKEYGFGLGWMVFKYDRSSIITNGGNDTGENALVYFSPERPGNGVVVFMNGGGVESLRAELEIIDMIDPGQKLTAFYRQLIAHHLAKSAK
jgi:CubicO group peptidase (beta-lactamase class C family)